MKVRATMLGYYNHRRRREGEVFEVFDEKAFSTKWMEKLDKPVEEPAPKKKPPVKIATVSQESSEEVI